ncbi:hypothetical protein [Leptospira licerasiae]|uniref:DUF1640 domain-containing protein n=1 Tax=Leptospira licerasiae str. MMD4847 TaxID=1049971 RepID=A0ABN0H9Z9_9LEPT|nr:hypothetical protein [Leptospira licerasiae]EIE02438.1 hypothetical protein LEP1GSC185_0977 [Leptospira licerasiae serovar Varillal str. VAR 010]EJZ42445.1 hypothetical protein LEP1GSC178_3568 [Leptospira licerasiae str. MMD4847]
MDEVLKYLNLFSPLSALFWILFRRELRIQIQKSKEEQREYVDSKMKVIETEQYSSSLRKHQRIDKLSDRVAELEKTHALEIALLRQTASTTEKRLDTIEARIEKLDVKIDEQKELLLKIHGIIEKGGLNS